MFRKQKQLQAKDTQENVNIQNEDTIEINDESEEL